MKKKNKALKNSSNNQVHNNANKTNNKAIVNPVGNEKDRNNLPEPGNKNNSLHVTETSLNNLKSQLTDLVSLKSHHSTNFFISRINKI